MRDRSHGGYLLGIITAPSREAAEEAAVQRFDLNGQQRAQLWLIDLGSRPAQKRAVRVQNGSLTKTAACVLSPGADIDG